jgi:hypothetical protein
VIESPLKPALFVIFGGFAVEQAICSTPVVISVYPEAQGLARDMILDGYPAVRMVIFNCEQSHQKP